MQILEFIKQFKKVDIDKNKINEVIEKCMNKAEVTRVADSSGIPTPKTYTLESGNILEKIDFSIEIIE